MGAAFRLYERSNSVEYGDGGVEWGLFHLIDRGKMERTSDGGDDFLRMSWTADLGGTIHADFKPQSLWKPFKGFDLPRSIVLGARGCGR
jgi:hypothetical protein